MPDSKTAKPADRVVLGFDYGLKQVGLAVGQTLTSTARPLMVIKAKDGIPQWHEIEAQIKQWQPQCLVVGLPLNMDGSESDMSVRARKFANRLHGRFGLPVEICDERLSSFAAKSELAEAKNTHNAEVVDAHAQSVNRGKRDGTVDAIAARLILESWFLKQ
jgi:putative Holliday junction resolvase